MSSTIDKINKTDKVLDATVEKQAKMVKRTILNLEKELLQASHNFYAGKPGGTKFKISHGVKLHKEILKVFANEYDDKIGDLIQGPGGYSQVEKLVLKHFKSFNIPMNYSTVDKQMLKALRKQDFQVYKTLGDDAQNKIAQSIYDSTLTGKPFSWLQKQIRGAITGHTDVIGRPLTMYAGTYAQDGIMKYYSTIHQSKAKEAGLDQFLYYGNTMKATRPFCAAMLGRTLTIKEIKALEKLSWKGKAPGNPLIVRGGYNCRHHWVAIDPSWLSEADHKHFEKERKRHWDVTSDQDKELVHGLTSKIVTIQKAVPKPKPEVIRPLPPPEEFQEVFNKPGTNFDSFEMGKVDLKLNRR